jgi:hypothetical protein
MASYPPTIADFKAQFDRDFDYGPGTENVRDTDITRALADAAMLFNPGLWDTIEQPTAYGYLAAHFLVLNIQGAGGPSAANYGKGLASHGGGTIESKSVGGVSVTFAVPDFVRANPTLSQLMKTDYGQKYLSLIYPRLVGNVAVIAGDPCGDVNEPGQ